MTESHRRRWFHTAAAAVLTSATPLSFMGCCCTKDIVSKTEPPVIIDYFPKCGPMDRETTVTLVGTGLAALFGAGRAAMIEEAGRSSEQVNLKVGPVDEAGELDLVVTWTEVTRLRKRCKKKSETACVNSTTVALEIGPFTFVDQQPARITDADPSNTPSLIDNPNPLPYHGNCGGGDRITITGRNFGTLAPPRVTWQGSLVPEEDILSFSNRELQMIVPPSKGDRTGPVAFTVEASPIGCGLESEPGFYLYDFNEPCDPPDGSVDHRYDLEIGSPGHQLVAIGDVVDDMTDLVGDSNDVVVASTGSGSSHLVVFRGDGGGALSRYDYDATSLGVARDLELGHFGVDPFLDAVLSFPESNKVLVLLNEGSGYSMVGASALVLDVAGGPRSLAIADFDGDGDDDIAVSCNDVPGTRLLRQEAPGEFDVHWGELSSTEAVQQLAAGEFDGAAGSELAILRASGQIDIWAASTPGDPLDTLWHSIDISVERPRAIRVAPVFGTSRDDLAVYAEFPAGTSVFANEGSGLGEEARLFLPAGISGIGLVVGDADGSGTLDVVVYDDSGNLETHLLDPTGSSSAPSSTSVGSFTVSDVAEGILDSGAAVDLVIGTDAGEEYFVVVLH